MIDSGPSEQCDDGNQVDDLTCSADCQHYCGDGVVDAILGEACDGAGMDCTDFGFDAGTFDCMSDCQPDLSGCYHVLASGQNTPYGIAVDSTHVYWTTLYGNTVMKVPLAGGTPTQLASQIRPYGIAVDSTHVFFGSVTGGTLSAVPVGGGAIVELASGQGEPRFLAVDSTHLYWTNTTNVSDVTRVLLGGGTATAVVPAQAGPTGIAVDATHIYWTSYNGGTVSKIPK